MKMLISKISLFEYVLFIVLFLFIRHLKLGLADWLGADRREWVLKHPGQVVLTVVGG